MSVFEIEKFDAINIPVHSFASYNELCVTVISIF